MKLFWDDDDFFWTITVPLTWLIIINPALGLITGTICYIWRKYYY